MKMAPGAIYALGVFRELLLGVVYEMNVAEKIHSIFCEDIILVEDEPCGFQHSNHSIWTCTSVASCQGIDLNRAETVEKISVKNNGIFFLRVNARSSFAGVIVDFSLAGHKSTVQKGLYTFLGLFGRCGPNSKFCHFYLL